MEKTCEDMGILLSAYLDGEVTEVDRLKVEDHLATCLTCQRLARELDATEEILKKAFSDTTQPEVGMTGMWTTIASRVDFGPSIWQRLKKLIQVRWVWMPAAIATAAVAVLVFLTPFQSPERRVTITRVESISSRSGQVMILQAGKTSQPIIWILPEKEGVG
jgi:anti-sigma factor RsiW